MSDQNNEYNSDAPPRQNPEPKLKEGGYVGTGNLMTMHQAQQGGGNDSFPVLQAFQEYIDAERKQARKRVMQLSIGFAAILGMVVVGFLAAGVSILRNTTSMQTKLMEIVAEKSSAPVQVQSAPEQPVQSTSPALEHSIREISRVLVKMQEGSKNSDRAVVPTAEKTQAAVPPVADPAVEVLRAEIAAMKAQSRKMEGELVSLRNKKSSVAGQRSSGSSKVVEEALARARKTGAEKVAADKAASETAAVAMAKKRAEEEKARLARVEAEKAIAVEMAAKRAKADREAVVRKVEKPVLVKHAPVVKKEKIPVATKAPPVALANVKSPKPPENMKGQSIALKTRNGSAVPWRIFVPE